MCDRAFRENAHHTPGREFLIDALEGGRHEFRVFLPARDGYGARGLEDEAQQRDLEYLVVHDKASGTRDGTTDEQRVDEAHVVCDEQGGSLARDPFGALHVNPVEQVDEDPHEKAHHEFRQQPEDVDRHDGVGDREHGEDAGHADARAQESDGCDRCDNHEHAVENVVGGNDARTLARPAAVLQQRVEWHAEQATRGTDECEVDEQAPVRGVRDKRRHIHGCAWRAAGKHDEHVEREHAQTNGTERHEAKLNGVAREALADQ